MSIHKLRHTNFCGFLSVKHSYKNYFVSASFPSVSSQFELIWRDGAYEPPPFPPPFLIPMYISYFLKWVLSTYLSILLEAAFDQGFGVTASPPRNSKKVAKCETTKVLLLSLDWLHQSFPYVETQLNSIYRYSWLFSNLYSFHFHLDLPLFPGPWAGDTLVPSFPAQRAAVSHVTVADLICFSFVSLMRCVFSARGDSAAGARGQQGAGRRLRVLGAAPEGPAPEGSAPEGPAPAAGRHVPTYRTH